MYYRNRLQELYSQRNILWTLSKKELKIKYSGAKLGLWWALIIPLLLTFVISVVFTKVFRVAVPNYTFFVLSAILPWIFFSTSLSETTSSIVNNAHLMRQFTIPKEFIPISLTLANFINFLFGLAVMIPIFIAFKIQIMSFLFLLPVALLLHLFFTIGLALFLSTINVYFRDIMHLLGVGLMFWFWVTPIFYSIKMVPEQYRWILLFNPMSLYITIYRDILFEARLPSLGMTFSALIIALVVLSVGHAIFVKYEASFIKRI